MSTEELTRELMAQQRHHEEHLKESMLSRAEAEVENSTEADSLTQEQARELAAQHRQEEQKLQESMLSRTKDEIS